jgi:enolase-phosphatase E1
MIKAVVTDIEGTTTSVAFVYDVLFPYARRELAAYIRAHANDNSVREQLALVGKEAGKSLTDEQAVQQLLEWMDADKKITPLKTLQGMIWEHGYRLGDFTGHIYDDVPANLRRWHARGVRLYVYSSGSVQAQQLLFGHTDHGDLTPLFSGYFDTRIGNKRDKQSYLAITSQLQLPASEILFLSDIEQELEAAQQAGMQTILLNRDHNRHYGRFPSVENFTDIKFD